MLQKAKSYLDKSNRSLFPIFLASYLCILTIPIIIGSISYMKSSHAMKEQLGHYNVAMLEQACQIIDGYLYSVDQLMTNVVTDPQIQGFLNTRDVMSLDDIYDMRNVVNQISKYKNSNSVIDSLYLYYKNSNNIVTHSAKYSPIFFYEKVLPGLEPGFDEWKEMHEKASFRQYIPLKSGLSSPNDSLSSNTRFIGYFQSLPFNERMETSAMAVILTDASKIETLLKKVDIISSGLVTILDQSNQEMVSIGDPAFMNVYHQKKGNDNLPFFYEQAPSGEVIVSSAVSKYNGWKYISIVPTRSFMKKQEEVKKVTLSLILLELLIGILLSYLLARRNYSPIKRVVDNLKGHMARKPLAVKNELKFIEEAANEAFRENVMIKREMQQHKPIMKSNFLLQLLKGGLHDPQYTRDSLEFFNIPFHHEFFSVLSVHIDEFSCPETTDSIEYKAMVKFVIGNVMEELGNTGYTACAVDVGSDNLALIVNLECESPTSGSELHRISRRVREFLSQHYSTFISVGIGSTHKGLEGINLSYEESKIALEYRMIKGSGSIIAYKDIRKSGNVYYYPLTMEQQVLHGIKAGNTEKVMDTVCGVFKQALHNRDISPQMLRYVFLNITSTAFKALHDLNVSEETLFGKEYHLVEKITECKATGAMYDILETVFRKICDYVNRNKQSHNAELKEAILSLIQEKYHENTLSLTMIADKMCLSPSYLSTFFKEQIGENFMDYVSEVRLTKAKELLRNTMLTTAQIAQKTGYANGNCLIRAFKKYYGITTGDYRSQVSKTETEYLKI